MAKILLVDDVDLFLELECAYLEDSGHELITASSGEETLQRLEAIAPDLLIVDYQMPGINGDDVSRAIRAQQQWQSLPILLVTAAGQPEEIRGCADSGCDDFITKPVNKQELQDKVKRLLGAIGRRTSERIGISLPIQVQDGEQTYLARSEDLSISGVYLKSASQLPENTTLEIILDNAQGEPLTIFGRVKRSEDDQSGGGIYFIYPDDDSKSQVDSLILKQKKADLVREGVDEKLSRRINALEQDCSRLRTEQDQAMRRINELEQENLDFANQLVQVEDTNQNLTNLYLATSRLHSTLDRRETLKIIKEVVINFVGAEKFAIFLHDSRKKQLVFETGEGFEDEEVFSVIRLGEGVLGKAAQQRENYFAEGSVSAGSDDPLAPLVAIPLVIHEQMIGLLAIYRLFIHKEQLESIDYQLFSMLGEHAATALFSSTLYSRSERKWRAYQDVVDLLLK